MKNIILKMNEPIVIDWENSKVKSNGFRWAEINLNFHSGVCIDHLVKDMLDMLGTPMTLDVCSGLCEFTKPGLYEFTDSFNDEDKPCVAFDYK